MPVPGKKIKVFLPETEISSKLRAFILFLLILPLCAAYALPARGAGIANLNKPYSHSFQGESITASRVCAPAATRKAM
jgi:hypothetical protein